MASSLGTLNRVSLLGYEAKDAIKKSSAKGSVVSFSLITHYAWKTKDGKYQKRSNFHRIVFFGPFADRIFPHLSKGKKLLVEGQLRNSSYITKDGEKKYTDDIVGNKILFLDRKPAASGNDGDIEIDDFDDDAFEEDAVTSNGSSEA